MTECYELHTGLFVEQKNGTHMKTRPIWNTIFCFRVVWLRIQGTTLYLVYVWSSEVYLRQTLCTCVSKYRAHYEHNM